MGRINTKNLISASYLAPVYRFIQNDIVNTSPGVSTQLIWNPLPGCKCDWFQEGQPVEVVNENTFKNWERIVVAKVPSGELLPTTNTAVLVMKQNPEVILIVIDKAAPKEWERFELALAPEEYWKTYGEFYTNDNTAMYYPEEFKVRVEIKDGTLKVPPTWVLEGDK